MKRVITDKPQKPKTASVKDALQRLENEGGITVTPPPEVKQADTVKPVIRRRHYVSVPRYPYAKR